MTRADGTRPSPTDPAPVAVNQVHFDEIPMPMPNGASSPFAWTFQPGGAHFDPPVEVILPNVGGLAPGSAAYILSFDHDTNRFEIVSSASVSDDGAFVRSDEGSGIAISGWGGACPPYATTAAATPAMQPIMEFRRMCDDGEMGRLRTIGVNPVTGLPATGCPGSPGGLTVGGGMFGPMCPPGCGGTAGRGGWGARGGGHSGADIAGSIGSPVYSMLPGEVVQVLPNFACGPGSFAGNGYGYGGRVVVRHTVQPPPPQRSYSFRVMYSHLASISVSTGPISQGAVIGTLGVSGNACCGSGPVGFCSTPEPHVHVAVFPDQANRRSPSSQGMSCDPLNFLPTATGCDGIESSPLEGVPDTFTTTTVQLGAISGVEDPVTANFSLLNIPIQAGLFRFRAQRSEGGEVYASLGSGYMQLVAGTVSTIDMRSLSEVPPPPDEVLAFVDTAVVTSTAQVQTSVVRGDDIDPAPGAAEGTTYQSTNPRILEVAADGTLQAISTGFAAVTVINEGATAVVPVVVSMGDPLTTVEGYVVDGAGNAVPGADVAVFPGGSAATTDAAGFFSIPSVATQLGDVRVTVVAQVSGETLVGSADDVGPMPGGLTDAGVIVVSDAVQWILDGDGFWDDAQNWSTGEVPQANDRVVIDRAAGNYT